LFDYKLLIYATNTIAIIVYEIKLTTTLISLQRISTVPVEKRSGRARMHADVHQTVVGLIKTMKDKEAMQFVYVQDQVKNRQLACGETISPYTCMTGIGIMLLIDVEAVIHIIKFSATISPLLSETTADDECSKTVLAISRTPWGRPLVSPHHSFLKIKDEGSDWTDSS
jgi:hypothetical protein